MLLSHTGGGQTERNLEISHVHSVDIFSAATQKLRSTPKSNFPLKPPASQNEHYSLRIFSSLQPDSDGCPGPARTRWVVT
jgi:hypothetical protein